MMNGEVRRDLGETEGPELAKDSDQSRVSRRLCLAFHVMIETPNSCGIHDGFSHPLTVSPTRSV